MERGQMSRALPEELVERILAMVPFPYIFKARVLSKAWLARLSPPVSSSQEGDEDNKQLAISFQKRVSEYTRRWKTFTPAFVGENGLVAHDYDQEPRRWQRMLTLSFLPENVPRSYSTSNLQIAGSLVLINTGHSEVLVVANVLTRSWKQLPPPPYTDGRFHEGLCEYRSLVSDLDTYKVIEIYDLEEHLFAQIYNSQLGEWFTKRLDIPHNLRVHPDGISLNGVFYWVVSVQDIAWGLLAFNAKEETFKVLEVALTDIEFDRGSKVYLLVVWNGSLVLVVHELSSRKVVVLKFDVVSQRWLVATRGPSGALKSHKFSQWVGTSWLDLRPYDWSGAVSDGDCILFLDIDSKDVVVYDMQKDEWSDFPIPPTLNPAFDNDQQNPFSFEPGLNPFVAL